MDTTALRVVCKVEAPAELRATRAQLRRERRRRAEARMRGLLVRDGVRLASHRGGPPLAPGPASPAAHSTDDFRALLARLRGPPAEADPGARLVEAVLALQLRLAALEGKLAAELTNEACSRKAGVVAIRELISGESMSREALRCSVQDLVASVKEEQRAHLATTHAALTAEKSAREAHQHSMIDGHATLEQRIDLVEGTLHDSVEKRGHADTLHAQLASDLAAPHPDRLNGALVAARDAREAHQNPPVAGRATLELRLAYVEGTLHDFVEKHGQAAAIHPYLTSALVASQNQSSSESSLRDMHPDTLQQRLDALEAKLDDELMKAASTRQAVVCDPVELHVALAAEAGAREALRASLVDRHLSLELQLNVRINAERQRVG